jgi:ABC-type sugar transport system permease subunit
MKKNCNFDERQLFIRGEAFKHGLIVMGLATLIDAFLKDNNIILVEGMWGNILMIAFTIAFIYTEMIFRNAINYDDKRMNRFFILLGCCALLILNLAIRSVVRDGIVINHSCILSKGIADLIMAILWLWIGIAFCIKKHNTKYEE